MSRKVIITGPESTGKTKLAEYLSDTYQGVLVPEYARTYIEQRGHSYTFQDVEHIAKWQAKRYSQSYPEASWVFFDTWLIVTRVWFEVVYGEVPRWVDRALDENTPDLVLLCYPDIAWEPDPVRENGGPMRDILYERYKSLLATYHYPTVIIRGTGNLRLQRAIEAVESIKK